jgi:hypothetical protein
MMMIKHSFASRTLLRAASLAALALLITSCGGGASTEQNNPPAPTTQTRYTGAAPATDDIQSFRVSLWENIRGSNRCGACHNEGNQAPQFARSDDVNLAYSAAYPLADLTSPSDSRLVVKVGGGHNCWLGNDASSAQACADIMTTWIENWAGDTATTGGREIQLVAPALIIDPSTSRVFPASSASFDAIHQLLVTNCATCHTADAATSQAPFFAAENRDAAYEAAKSKIDLDDPANSRFVLRLRDEFHNCWTNCPADAAEMQTAIENFANPIVADSLDPDAVVNSKAMSLPDGIVASGGNRYETNQVALWEFKSPPGSATAFDTSGVDPAIDLSLSGDDIDFIGGWGIIVRDGKAQGSAADSRKLYATITATGEYSIEAWVAPANVTQEDAYIVSYSGSDTVRNFTLGQTLYNYDAFNRSSNADENGTPALSTADADEDLQATLQHVVVNFDPVNGRSIYVNGVYTDDVDAQAGGDIGSWSSNFAFVLGNETSSNRQWQGVIRMVAIHNRVLTPAQITQNFDVGVGQKYFLLFYLGDHITDVPDPYLMIEVSQFDSYSYLFNEPRFISLDASVTDANADIAGIRIGVNGLLPEVGQAFQYIDTTDAAFSEPYTAEGQTLLRQGTIIPIAQGPEQDQFFLSFELLGSSTNVITRPAPLVPGDPPDGAPVPDYGLRTFEEISESMSALTTISSQDPLVKDTFQRVKQQLPTVENLGGFLSAHQMAVAQLSIEYCNALVEDTGKRATYWPDFSFPGNIGAAFGTPADRNTVFDPLLERLVLPDGLGAGLATQPDIDAVRGELDWLVSKLTACYDYGNDIDSCDAGRVETTVKAICAAAVGNAAMLVQ